MPAASAVASPSISYAYADVLRVDPLYETVRISRPRESCREEPPASRDDPGRAAGGAVVGAIIGGAVGSQIGSGRGRRAATAAGVVAGAVIGSQAARADQPAGDEREPRCRPVEAWEEERRIVGYDVEYRYRGQIFRSRLPYDPGERLRIRITVEPAE
ncbi:MAG: glycine zipper 2TM domain-containing protein [Xanthomonadales bacterium]|nr:glycine zipper 2TM domain-containing protein [Xanthomonadales bacterium]